MEDMDTEADKDIPLTIRLVNRLWLPVSDRAETSEQYMKRITSAAVSHVLYLRRFFYKSCFETKPVEYLRLWILRDRCKLGAVNKVVTMLMGMSTRDDQC